MIASPSRMSLKARIFLLTIAVTASIVTVLFLVQIGNVVDAWLAGSQEIAEIAGQQITNLLIVRLHERETANTIPAGTDRKQALTAMVQSDRNLVSLLETTMAQARSIIEISIADRRNIVIASSNPLRAGTQMPVRPELNQLRTAGTFQRILPLIKGATDYQILVPLGLQSEPTPVFAIHVLVSSVLLRDELYPAVRRVAIWGIWALLASILLAWLSARLAVRNLSRISGAIDRISSGEDPLAGPKSESADREFAAIESKLNLLGHRVRGVAELRANVQTVMEALEEAILLFDSRNSVMLAGGAVERLLGWRPPSIIGWSLDQVLPRATPIGAIAFQAFESHEMIKDAVVDHSRDGIADVLIVSIDFTPDPREPGGSTALMRIRNSAAHHQLESHLGLSARMDAISRITSGVAHEIKNPLNSIAVRLDNLQSWAVNSSPEAEEEIQFIVQEVNRLDRVVRTFLDFTRPVELARDQVDLIGLLRGIGGLLEPDATRRAVQIRFSVPTKSVYVRGDEDLLTEAMMNIANNAIEAMPLGGVLSITVTEAGEGCSVTIADTGTGIPDSQREKIFELYFTTKKDGSGLGLPMAFRAIELHGGAMEVESQLGKGTSFHLNLPIIVE